MSDVDKSDVDSGVGVGKSAGDNSQIEVFGRLRPSNKNDKTVCIFGPDHRSVEFRLPRDGAGGYINNKQEVYEFKMNHIFDADATQADIFEGIGKPVVQNVLEGFNGTIFAYGQTGSGKTFTITGGPDRYEDRGLIPRTLSMIFAEKEARSSEYLYSVSISYLEIYNDDGYDLLDADHETKSLTELPKVAMFEDDTGNIHMRNIHLLPANSVDEALNLLFVGDTNRVICETPSNDASSRSHCIFTIYVESREVGGSRIRRSKLHLVDLAGSERVKKTQIQGKILTEALHINLALHYLEQVIVALHKRSRDKNVHIPYRNSMMTSVLRDSLGGNCKTVMIATMSAQRGHIDESISTCRFAARVAMVRNAAVVNEEIDPKLVIRKLKMQLKELREELAAAQGQDVSTSKPLDEDELAHCRKLVHDYCGSDQPTVDAGLPNKLKVQACFEVFKELLVQAREGAATTTGGAAGGVDGFPSLAKSLHAPSCGSGSGSVSVVGKGAQDEEVRKLRLMVSSRDNEIAILVSMLKSHVRPGQEIEILEGVRERAGKQASKDTGIEGVAMGAGGGGALQQSLLLSKGVQQLTALHQSAAAAAGLAGSSSLIGATAEEDSAVLEQRLQAFEEFRRSYRKNQLIEEQNASLRTKIHQAQKLGESINAIRNEMNGLKAKVEARRVQRGVQHLNDPEEAAAQDEADPEEEAAKSRIEAGKVQYRAQFASLKDLKAEIDQLKHLIERSRRKLQQDFDVWWEEHQRANGVGGGKKPRGPPRGPADPLSATQPLPVQSPPSPSTRAPSARAAAPPYAAPIAVGGGLISGSYAAASGSPSSHAGGASSSASSSFSSFPPVPASSSASVLSARGSPPASALGSAPRLPSTGNAQADADIAKFYAMRDSLLQQQKQQHR